MANELIKIWFLDEQGFAGLRLCFSLLMVVLVVVLLLGACLVFASGRAGCCRPVNNENCP
ncbi:hypothetical protein CPSG_06237 [Coccidioides posadasii str. Silveira]|uniref:Uncharacterized protein n=1 Tax=Coccidioides posadasii (strain RMSCC 757 / Silveira) TaxID=443226 RepID=E9D8T5_COCPS|nr:hypothetical protein CPSG_06237 [Coccidioides posadasii str. Silveira]